MRFAVSAFLLSAAMLATPAAVLAATTTCTGTITGGPGLDTVDVPAGASCTLASLTVNNGVTIGAGSSLTLDAATVNNNTTGTDAASLSLINGASAFFVNL